MTATILPTATLAHIDAAIEGIGRRGVWSGAAPGTNCAYDTRTGVCTIRVEWTISDARHIGHHSRALVAVASGRMLDDCEAAAILRGAREEMMAAA